MFHQLRFHFSLRHYWSFLPFFSCITDFLSNSLGSKISFRGTLFFRGEISNQWLIRCFSDVFDVEDGWRHWQRWVDRGWLGGVQALASKQLVRGSHDGGWCADFNDLSRVRRPQEWAAGVSPSAKVSCDEKREKITKWTRKKKSPEVKKKICVVDEERYVVHANMGNQSYRKRKRWAKERNRAVLLIFFSVLEHCSLFLIVLGFLHFFVFYFRISPLRGLATHDIIRSWTWWTTAQRIVIFVFPSFFPSLSFLVLFACLSLEILISWTEHNGNKSLITPWGRGRQDAISLRWNLDDGWGRLVGASPAPSRPAPPVSFFLSNFREYL